MRTLIVLVLCSAALSGAEVERTFSPKSVRWGADHGCVTATLPGALHGLASVGSPDLPCLPLQIVLPEGAGPASLRVTWDEAELARDVVLAPVQPPCRPGLPRPAWVKPDPAVYASAAVLPGVPAVLDGIQMVRGRQIAQVRLSPLRYQASTGTVALCTRIGITIETAAPVAKPRLAGVGATRRRNDARVLDTLVPLVANPEALAATTTVSAPLAQAPATGDGTTAPLATAVDYLIITSTALATEFQRLADRRAATHGYATAVVTTESIASGYAGSDMQQKIRACITSHVDNQGTWIVVLGGDDTVVIDRDTTVSAGGETESAMPTDLYYSCLDGTWNADGDSIYGEVADGVDLGFDVVVGRIPVRTTAQAKAYIDKVIRLEDTPPAGMFDKFLMGGAGLNMISYPNGTGRSTDLGIESVDGHLPLFSRPGSTVNDDEAWSRRLHRDYVAASGFTASTIKCFFSSLTSWDGPVPGDYEVNDANMATRFNENWGLVWWFTHGNYTLWSAGGDNGGFNPDEALALTGYTQLIGTAACLTAGFDMAEPCLSEGFLRNPDGGAVVYLGCSRFGWGGSEPYGGPSPEYAGIFYRLLLGGSNRMAGPAFAGSKQYFASACTYDNSYRWIQFGLNFQGDPAYRLRLNNTPPLRITTAGTLPAATAGNAWSTALEAGGGTPTYRWGVAGSSYVETPGDSADWVAYDAIADRQGWREDDGTHVLDLPFSFPFYNLAFSRVLVSTNGVISFARTYPYGNSSADELMGGMMIAGLWKDLRTDQATDEDIYVTRQADRVAITWKGCLYDSVATKVHFQVILGRDGGITCVYKDAHANLGTGGSPMVGVSLGDGRTCTLSDLDGDTSIPAGTSRRFSWVSGLPAWLRLSPAGALWGTPEQAQTVTLTALCADSDQPIEWASKTFTLAVGAAPTSLPPPWLHHDIGTVGSSGSGSWSSGIYTVAGAGAGLAGTADGGSFVHRGERGDCVLTARVDQFGGTPGASAQAGIALRTSTAAEAAGIALLVTPGQGAVLLVRTAAGGVAQVTTLAGLAPPLWLRLERAGDLFTATTSADGTTWTPAGSATVSLPSGLLAGLWVSGRADPSLATASFSQVSLTGQRQVSLLLRHAGAEVLSAASATQNSTVIYTDEAVVHPIAPVDRKHPLEASVTTAPASGG